MKFDQLRDYNRNIFTEKSYIKCGQKESLRTESELFIIKNRIFLDLQKTLDTVDHDILLHKPFHYEIIVLVN